MFSNVYILIAKEVIGICDLLLIEWNGQASGAINMKSLNRYAGGFSAVNRQVKLHFALFLTILSCYLLSGISKLRLRISISKMKFLLCLIHLV